MNIKKLVQMGAASLIIVLLIGGALASTRINVIRIGGPVQTQMQQASDLVADILPPPEYVLEPFLEATLLMRKPGEYDQRAKRLAQLQKDYDTRHAYWAGSNLEPSLRNSVTQGSHLAAEKFWNELTVTFLPAVKALDDDAIEASYVRLEGHYNAHRAMVDRAVALAADYQADLKTSSENQLKWAIGLLMALAVAILTLVGAACYLLLRKVVQPLTDVVSVTTTLAHGEAAIVPHQARNDELGEMARAVELFRLAAEDRAAIDAKSADELRQITTALAGSLAALKDGDLTRFVSGEYPAGYAVLQTNFNDALSALREMIQLVSESAAEISTGSSEIAQAAEDLARRTESNAASLEQTNAALMQVEVRIKTTSADSVSTVARADLVITSVQSGRATADHAVLAMDRVSGSARGIDSVIEGLDKIAFQTRVLAMNAAVEAGRAGEAGRGFAVVADLVSALAMRAEEEAKRARDQLSVTQTEIVTAVQAVLKVDGALAAIANDVAEVHQLLGSMARDNQSQSLAISEITVAIGMMDRSTQQNAAMVEETSAATRNLSGEVQGLADRAAAFKFERRSHNLAVSNDRRGPQESLANAPHRADTILTYGAEWRRTPARLTQSTQVHHASRFDMTGTAD